MVQNHDAQDPMYASRHAYRNNLQIPFMNLTCSFSLGTLTPTLRYLVSSRFKDCLNAKDPFPPLHLPSTQTHPRELDHCSRIAQEHKGFVGNLQGAC